MKLFNPATEALLADTLEQVGNQVLAMLVRERWAASPLHERLDIVRRFRGLMVERKEKLAQMLTSEVGKPITQSRSELDGTLSRIDFFLENVPKVLREEIVLKRASARGEDHPRAFGSDRQHLGLELPLLRRLERLRARPADGQHGAL